MLLCACIQLSFETVSFHDLVSLVGLKAFQVIEVGFELRILLGCLMIHQPTKTKRTSSVVEICISQDFWQMLLVWLVNEHLFDAFLSIRVGHLSVSSSKVLCWHDSLLLFYLVWCVSYFEIWLFDRSKLMKLVNWWILLKSILFIWCILRLKNTHMLVFITWEFVSVWYSFKASWFLCAVFPILINLLVFFHNFVQFLW